MQPLELRPQSFSQYPPLGRAFAIKHLQLLQNLPLALLPIFLREIMGYDWSFPAERDELDRQFDYLQSLQTASFVSLMAPFSNLTLSREIEQIDWLNQPQHFSEQLSALLWSSQQIDAYHNAAAQYQKQLEPALAGNPPALPRFTIVAIGQGAVRTDLKLFRSLRQHGVLFTAVQPDRGIETLLDFVNKRAQNHPEQYAHWYIDGGQADPSCSLREGVTVTSYNQLAPFAMKELSLTQSFVEQSSAIKAGGAEVAQSFMANLSPDDLGLNGNAENTALRHFETRILTEGAGTQIFSTTFVQWAAREALRRAQPVTLFARFAPRQQMAPMNELLRRNPLTELTDPEGSLVDADMGAYYTWLNQGRLSGADQARFLVWFEGHELALAIGPTVPRGTTSSAPGNMTKILEWIS
ncbi:MAG: hypothetical protein ABR928_01985 [Terracidiphilus sp.]|jgi:hypothetical protein